MLPLSFTSTPAGIVIGSFPILDIYFPPLPNVADYFAAHAFFASVFICKNSFRSGQNRQTETAQYTGNLIFICINAQSWFADALESLNNLPFLSCVLQVDP